MTRRDGAVWVSLVGEVVRGNKKLNDVDVGDLRDRLRGGCETVVNAKSSARGPCLWVPKKNFPRRKEGERKKERII